MLKAWMFLVAAIATEVAATLTMSESGQSGDTRMYVLMWILISSSYVLLSFALRKIQVGVAVAIWEGLGTSLIAVISLIFLAEPFSLQKVLGILISVLGIVFLHFGSDE